MDSLIDTWIFEDELTETVEYSKDDESEDTLCGNMMQLK